MMLGNSIRSPRGQGSLAAALLLAPLAIAQLAPPPRAPTFNDFLRFSCSELNVQRIDP